MDNKLIWALVLGAVTGCSGAGSTSPPLDIPPPKDGLQLTFGPYDVPPRDPATGFTGDTQLCRTMKLSNDEPIAINRIDVHMTPGSHHFIIFRARQNPDGTEVVNYEDRLFDCKGTVNFDEWDFVMDVNASGGTDWQMGDGQAMIFKEHAQIMVQSHFLNGTVVTSPEGGYVVANLYKSPTPVDQIIHPLHGMFTVNTRLAIPPHTLDWKSSKRCSFSHTVNIVAMTGHFHQQGRDFLVDQMDTTYGVVQPGIYCTGPDCADPVGKTKSWDSPWFKIFDKPLLVNGAGGGAAQGIEFTCSYDNNTDNTIYFGGLAGTQEHCNLFFQYFDNIESSVPNGPLTCAEGSGGW